MQKMAWFGAVMGHSRSWVMPPFDRAYMSSYSTLIETMRLTCTVFEIYPVISPKSPILTDPTCIWRPRRVDPGRMVFGIGKLESLSYRVVLFV